MIQISVHHTTVKNNIQIDFDGLHYEKADAFLLGKGGEELKHFSLCSGFNQLDLDGLAAGFYSLRIETGKDVTVKQIEITT